MKKLVVAVFAAVMMLGSVNVVANANPAQDLRDQLTSIVGSDAANALVSHVQTIKLTNAEVSTLEGYVNDALAIIGDTKDLQTLSNANKDKLVSIAKNAGNIVGLEVNFGAVNGVKTLTVKNAKGNTLFSLNKDQLGNAVTNFNPSSIKAVVASAKEVITIKDNNNNGNNNGNNGNNGNNSNNGNHTGQNKPDFLPMPDTELNDTGNNYASMVLAGSGVMALAAVVFVASRRFAK